MDAHPSESIVDSLEVYCLNFRFLKVFSKSKNYLFVLNVISLMIVALEDLGFEILESVVN